MINVFVCFNLHFWSYFKSGNEFECFSWKHQFKGIASPITYGFVPKINVSGVGIRNKHFKTITCCKTFGNELQVKNTCLKSINKNVLLASGTCNEWFFEFPFKVGWGIKCHALIVSHCIIF